MHSIRIGLGILFVACWSVVNATPTTATGSFYLEIRGSGRQVSISKKATFDDVVYFRVRVDADDGDHSLLISIYDGSGRQVYNAESTLTVSDGRTVNSTHYGFKDGRDAPGSWWYVASVDGKIVASESLVVEH